jgi:hypothetical protein
MRLMLTFCSIHNQQLIFVRLEMFFEIVSMLGNKRMLT